MKAELLARRRVNINDSAFAEIVVWKLPESAQGSTHRFKYRLAYVVNNKCVLRYDNEAGKGGHRHFYDEEKPYKFISIDRLLNDFTSDVAGWSDEDA